MENIHTYVRVLRVILILSYFKVEIVSIFYKITRGCTPMFYIAMHFHCFCQQMKIIFNFDLGRLGIFELWVHTLACCLIKTSMFVCLVKLMIFFIDQKIGIQFTSCKVVLIMYRRKTFQATFTSCLGLMLSYGISINLTNLG